MRTRSHLAASIWLSFALLLILGLMAARAFWVGASTGAYAGCESCLIKAALVQDAQLWLPWWAIVLALCMLAKSSFRLKCLRVTFGAIGALLTLLYSADLLVFKLLNFRLLWTEVFKFYGDAGSAFSVLRDLAAGATGVLLLVACVLAVCAQALLPWLISALPHPRRWVAGVSLTALLAWCWPAPGYLLHESYQNVLKVNLPQPLDRAYSARFAARVADTPTAQAVLAPGQCIQAQAQRLNVTVLVVESLSSYHSALLGGPWAVTPNLDRRMRKNRYFPNFIANGFSTDGGLISLFSGHVPIPAQGRFRSVSAYTGFAPARANFYAQLKNLGYQSAFLFSADKHFLQTAEWMHTLGFEFIEGAESAFYADWPRGQFGAAEDRALYQRTLSWMAEQHNAKPYFLGVLTTSTHPPFKSPADGSLDESKAFRYADQALEEFVQNLERARYFSNGMLIVVGDHRAMTPLKTGEPLNAQTFSRVPMLVIGPDLQNANATATHADVKPYQQSDLIPSLLSLIGRGEQCLQPDQGRFLGAFARPADVRVFVNGVQRELVLFTHAGGDARLRLAGDDSALEGAPHPVLNALANKIHRDRILRGPAQNNLAELVLGRSP